MKISFRFACLAICVASCVLSTRAAVTFQGLGDLPGGSVSSDARAISADGSVVVGYSNSNAGNEAFRWTSSGGMVGLGDLSGGTFFSAAYGVSADGSVIVGQSAGPSGNEAFRWTSSGGMVGLGDLSGGTFTSTALGVSADGSVVVGDSNSSNGNEAFRWTSSGGMVGLGDLPGGSFSSEANGVSANGSVVAGTSNDANGFEAFRWTSSGMTSIGVLSGGSVSVGNAISADGTVIVGRCFTSGGDTEAFRWTNAGGMVGIGDLSGGIFNSEALGVSADGSVIVGDSASSGGGEAFRWDATHGMQSITALLTAAGIDLSGWTLAIAYGVSADGTTIVGTGTHNGNLEGWVATFKPDSVPAPASAVTVSGKKKIIVTKAKLTLKGTSANAVKVEVKVGRAAYKPARGVASWTFVARLAPGTNKILVRAVNAAGLTSAPAKVTVVLQ